MIELDGFKSWLTNNTTYSKRVISNIVSRFKRANTILPWFDDDIYQFRLEQNDTYKNLSVNVRSQIKKAVKLYFQYHKEAKN